MIISDAPPEIIAKLRHMAGPSPTGTRITHNERLHLIYQFTALHAAMKGATHLAFRAVRQIYEQLTGRGMSRQEIDDVFEQNKHAGPVELADAFAVHPSLYAADYLD